MELINTVKQILLNNNLIKSYIGDKIFPIFADDNTVNPFIVLRNKLLNSVYTVDGLLYDNMNLDVIVITDNYNDATKIIKAVRNCLEFKCFDTEYLSINSNIGLESIDETYGIDGYITTLVFAVQCKSK